MTTVLIAHFIAAAIAPLLVRQWGRNAFLALAVVPGVSTLWALFQIPAIMRGETLAVSIPWAPEFSLRLGLYMDALGLVMTLIAAGVGALILIYCARYFDDSEPGLARFAGVFVAFAGAMLGLVLADDLIQLFVYWELTTVFSYLLIGHSTELKESRRAAMTALTVTTFGGLAMLVGMIMLGETAGTYVISEIVASPPAGALVNVALVLIMVGAMSKSALLPFSLWLPAAMRAPTPVSGYLHAAAMVKAGVYLVARLTPAFHDVAVWKYTALFFGTLTMVLAGWKALRQYDLKLVLAYGTISQLGFLITLLGAGTQAGALAGISMLIAHSLFKAPLFLVVGVIDHSTGTRDLRELSGLRSSMPVTFWTSVVALASMAGLPPTLGFAAKELAFGAFEHGGGADIAVLAGIVIGSTFTVAYSLRFLWGAFWDKENVPATPLHAPGPLLQAPAAVLAGLGLLGGLLSTLVDPFLAVYADTVPVAEGDYAKHLALWHGLGLPLLLSAVCVAGGLALFRFRHEIVWAGTRTALPDADRVYRRMLAALENLALQVTGGTQRGSLPVYLGTILVTLVVAAGWWMVSGRIWEGDYPAVRLWDSPVQIIPVLIIGASALLTLFVRRRLFAVILVGTGGYGVAALFYLMGAPDIALTQFLVETVSLVVFVLVLRRFPARFSAPALRGRRVWNLALGAATGVLVAAMTWFALAGRQEPSISAGYPAAAEEAGGYNIISVLLVDVRAWDTMGEISVLAAAAAGVASLMFVRRRAQPRKTPGGVMALSVTEPPPPADGQRGLDLGGLRFAPRRMHVEPRWARTWLPGADALPTERRSVIFEVVSRFLFPVIMVISVYLLLTGHTAIGGGFAGGIVAGLAFIVRYLAGGRFELYATAWVQPGALIGAGLAVATGTALGGAVFGTDVLAGGDTYIDFWILGEAHVTVSMLFDIGVYLLVIGLILDILRSLGARIDEQIERDAAHSEAQARTGGPERPEEVIS
ncbi:Multiple resistance and pH homeostasis protein A [Nocardiopsis dassonvillei]|uniref:NADH/Ubiquinone/plastoquinone (Complex I) n=1 Tax=Nocardiopsis dassonvillei (strain ATCC 23218 / DSM 43111 / CIP 107115 / JCM 7437 / KCTC 9190 / NBRC 14626 / NCTC 10488 / NRRL B-5397 / IMRU 509) TaxID=446468 RepID=D7B7W9_NOCDD|nr:NADH/Ubiquinone/plastoquinone (complex I) [Nocardiopsis dassonvillei subsp. dassonvillei DSM 43111]VEI91184.1 Multiple resistance and pH homeostasis protein A [Nocardiopsis dassonvillei]